MLSPAYLSVSFDILNIILLIFDGQLNSVSLRHSEEKLRNRNDHALVLVLLGFWFFTSDSRGCLDRSSSTYLSFCCN